MDPESDPDPTWVKMPTSAKITDPDSTLTKLMDPDPTSAKITKFLIFFSKNYKSGSVSKKYGSGSDF